jgi:peptidoglycan/xylan/chitin deacetylase (PgdA/CDA1 family)
VLGRRAPLLALATTFFLPVPGGGGDRTRAAIPPLPSRPILARAVGPSSAPLLSPWDSDAAPLLVSAPGHGPHTRFQPAASPRELLLSFDDGPDLKGTPLILEELDRRGLKAIFFVSGGRCVGTRPEDLARRDLLRKIASHGHLVANHTLSHRNLCANPGDQANEIDDNSEIIAQATGVRPSLFRAPYGAFCRSLEAALDAREMVDIGWNLDPQDWKNNTPDRVFNYLIGKLSHLQGRGILLMHDTHAASVHALPQILDWLTRENRRAVKEGRPPIQLIDYRSVLPARAMTQSGLELIVGRFITDLAPAVARLLPATPRL